MKRNYKKNLYLALLFLLFSSLIGCSTVVKTVKDTISTNESITEKEIKSPDGKMQVTVYSDWNIDKELSSEGDIQASNRLKEKYVIVVSDSLQDFAGDIKLEDITKSIKESMVQDDKNATISNETDMTINGLQAKSFEFQTVVENVKARSIIAAVKGKNGIYQVITWSVESKYEENKEELKKVIQSFKEL